MGHFDRITWGSFARISSVLTYDHDIFVQISDTDSPKGIRLNALDGNPILGRRVSYSQQVLLKYTYTFE